MFDVLGNSGPSPVRVEGRDAASCRSCAGPTVSTDMRGERVGNGGMTEEGAVGGVLVFFGDCPGGISRCLGGIGGKRGPVLRGSGFRPRVERLGVSERRERASAGLR